MSTEPRLKSDLLARALVRESARDGRSAMVLRKGDSDAGGILVVLLNRAGESMVLSQTRTPDGDRAWIRSSGPTPLNAQDTQAYIDRQVKYDPDLWVLEMESDDFSPPFQAMLL
ncbi:DUF1491 family protein [Acetobacter suratthaniensis]|uniref:DUF1491 family protein n=1 Tax=Acetobacter suratthaniensis TaxID=1502841 RepID=A0ABS3LHI9_9PROT|nr:DUF1491 family protein [Acetobacter suratthaniensis]MBO1327063.1 DUF1491 family protein [Acetobacter suratthaniensis]MCX2565327.1 DUF1491 family protein [Acetobacter suratthaniensis]